MDGQWIICLGVPFQGDDDGRYVAAPYSTVLYLDGESVLGLLELAGIQVLDDTARIILQFVSVTFKDSRGKLITETLEGGVTSPANKLNVTLARNDVTRLEVERWGLDGRGSGSLNLCFWEGLQDRGKPLIDWPRQRSIRRAAACLLDIAGPHPYFPANS